MTWLIWGLLLLVQNAAFTMVSRARNSGSLVYHGTAAVFSNGVWFFAQFFVVDIFLQVRDGASAYLLAGAAVFYITLTVLSSVTMHHILMSYIETGKRKVGSG